MYNGLWCGDKQKFEQRNMPVVFPTGILSPDKGFHKLGLYIKKFSFLLIYSKLYIKSSLQLKSFLTAICWFISNCILLILFPDTVYVICFSLIMLSVDLFNPHIKNKMSKREFIRNTRRAAEGINDEFAGHLYDNIYLIGHVAPKA